MIILYNMKKKLTIVLCNGLKNCVLYNLVIYNIKGNTLTSEGQVKSCSIFQESQLGI